MSASIRLHHSSCPSILFSCLGPRLSPLWIFVQRFGSLQPAHSFSTDISCCPPFPVPLHWFFLQSPCQNGTGFLPQISNINLTSRCPLLPCHQLLVPDDLLVPYCLPAFSCQSFQPVIKSHSVSLLPTSVPGSCPHYLTCLLYLLLSHSVLLHIS